MSQISITNYAVDDWRGTGAVAYLRLISNGFWVDSDGDEHQDGSYTEYELVVNTTTHRIDEQTIVITSTQDAIVNSRVRYTVQLLDANRKNPDVRVDSLTVPYSTPVMTWAALLLGNLPQLPWRDTETMTRTQIIDYVEQQLGAVVTPDASAAVKGMTKLSAAPLSAVDPVAVGTEDLRYGSVRLIDATKAPYSVLSNATAQSTAALQSALDAVAASSGLYTGVYLPPGRYRFNSGTLSIPQGVALVGSWDNAGAHTWISEAGGPDATDGKGTTIEIDTGAGSASGTPFITTHGNVSLKGFCFYYPTISRATTPPTGQS